METNNAIESIKEFLNKNYYNDLINQARLGKKSILIDFKKITLFNPEISDYLLDDTENAIKCFEIAMESFSVKNVTIRICNLPHSNKLRIRDIRSEHVNKLITIEGVIRSTSDVRPKAKIIKYECPSCGQSVPIIQLEKNIIEPTRCGCGRKGKFKILDIVTEDSQFLRLEESMESLNGTEQPRTFNIILLNDLTSPYLDKKTTPGSKVQITGIIKQTPQINKMGAKSTIMDLVMDANCVIPLNDDYDDIKISKEDVIIFEKFSKQPDMFNQLVCSYAPTIDGYEEIKLAIILQAFSGVRKSDGDGALKRRENFHLLLIGDPAVAKSQIIRYALKIIPKVQYCSGAGTSGRGITASVVKDEFVGGYTLQGGAAVMAHKGVLIVDEINLMDDDDRKNLNEALEQQTISIHKATIHANLQAEISLLAAGNPKHDRFSNYSSIAEQINLPDALLSRFDLVFIIKDTPDEKKDTCIIDKILDVHMDLPSCKPALDTLFLKKYISYARQHIRPKLTIEASTRIKEIYLQLRQKSRIVGDNEMVVSITARQAEGLVRLSEASAKARLSNIVEVQDVERANKLIMYSLNQTIFDAETGTFDVDKITSSVNHSQRTKIHLIVDFLKENKKGVYGDEIEKYMLMEHKVNERETQEIMSKLNKMGDILQVKPDYWLLNL
jgi:replicative DNA helicase Mcm